MNHVRSTGIDHLANEIAANLGETTPEAQHQIAAALERYGAELIQSLVAEALDIEREGGMPLTDGSRQRTRGGVFFRLLRERTRQAGWAAVPPLEDATPLKWDNRIEAVQSALSKPGTARVAKTTVVGRPEEIKLQDDFVVLRVPGDDNLPSLPRGLPRPPNTTTRFLVCILGWHWPGHSFA